jgi:hypothetical protein
MSPRHKNPAAVALGRMRSPAKTRAARENGRRGGRAPKFAIGDQARANDKAPGDYEDRTGIVTEIGPGKSEFRVEFDDGQQPTTGYLMSWCLDKT